jgi:hypothetical protein
VSFPEKWELHTVLLPNTRAVDCTPFVHRGSWWMIVGQTAPFALGVRPLLYRAECLEGPWERCLEGPISDDVTRARNGGILAHGGNLYRAIQQAGYDDYGSSLIVTRIDEVSASEFRETFVADFQPSHSTDIQGGHHLHGSARWTVFDVWEYRSMRFHR